MSAYSELLKDVRWQKRRLELLTAANWSCVKCGYNKRDLQIHHHVYRKGVMPWEYEDHCFSVLCNKCHEEVTEYRQKLMESIATYEKHGYPMMVVTAFVDTLLAMSTDEKIFITTPESLSGAAAAIGAPGGFVHKFVDIGSGKLDPGEVVVAMADCLREGSD
jgi:hypothetical protein